MNPTRRQFLTVGAAAGTGLVAGCSQIPFIGGGGPGGFTNWVPEAGELNSENETVQFSVRSPAQISSNRDSLHPSDYRSAQSSYRTGIEWSAIDMELTISNMADVYAGSFDATEIQNELTTATGSGGGEFTQDGSEGDYDIYIPDGVDDAGDANQAYAVSGNTVISTNGAGLAGTEGFRSAVDVAERVIRVGEEGNDRAVDADENFSTLADELDGTFIQGRTRVEPIQNESIGSGQFGEMVASGRSTSINGDNTEITEVFVFETDDDVNTGDLEEYVERNDTGGGRWTHARNVSVNENGNAGVITGTIDTYDLGRTL